MASLVDRHRLAPDASERLAALLEILVTDPLAPTTLHEPRRAVEDHLADALIALELPEVHRARRIVDLGAGAGVPGLPLAVALPAVEVTLLESSRRKCAFIERAIACCRAENASVVCARAEAWPDGVEAFDLATARALAPLPVVAEYAAPLLRVGGSLVAWRGRRDPAQEEAARVAADALGLLVAEPRSVEPYPGVRHRHLQVMTKVRATPDRFPRRPGIARKRPLG